MSKKFDVSLLVQFENDLPLTVRDINGDEVRVVDYKAVHAVLGVGTRHDDWFKRQVDKFGFVEGKDYITIERDPNNTANWTAIQAAGGKTRVTWLMTTDMAKEVCMVSATPVGKQVREYFILAEKVAREFALDELRKAVSAQALLVEHQKALVIKHKAMAAHADNLLEENNSVFHGHKTNATAIIAAQEKAARAGDHEADRDAANAAACAYRSYAFEAFKLLKQGKSKEALKELESADGLYSGLDSFMCDDYPWAKFHREKVGGI